MPASSTAPSVLGAGVSGAGVLGGLDAEQRAVAEALSGPVCVLAGAGTGKTRAITHRIAHGVLSGAFPAEHVLAVTFTARAAGEMRGRLRGLGVPGVQARTFHAAALRQLSYFWPRAIGGQMPSLVESKARLVVESANRMRVSTDRSAIRDLTAEIEWAKSSLLTPESYAAAAGPARRGIVAGLGPEDIGRLYAGYETARRRADLLDFEELLLLTVGIIAEHPDVADELRGRYRHFVVDEYQDVTPLQQALLDAWLGDRDDLCVVGDAAQTIYSFTGASPKWLLEFPKRFPSAAVVRLVRDYRSTPQVVELANRVLAAGHGSAASNARVALIGQRPPGPQPAFHGSPSEPEEAAEVARRIQDLLDAGTPASEIAVLYRINAQSEVYEAALADAHIPYVVRGGVRFFERPEIREAIVLLRGAARALDPDAPQELSVLVREILASRWKEDAPPAVTARAEREKWDSVAALVRLADDRGGDLPSLLVELEDRASAQHAPVVEGVSLVSLHAAKGLEWDAVFLVGLVDGTLPLQHAETPEEIEEERRLLYVGVTRARMHLTLSWAAARQLGGRGNRQPSRFLAGIAPQALRDRDNPRSRSSKSTAACRVCGEVLLTAAERKARHHDSCEPVYDLALFERLRTWRAERAKLQSQPAYCVFTDLTLERIAEARPTSRAELAGVSGVGAAKLDKYGPEVLAIVTPPGELAGL